jgi:hypothetical protein
VLEQGLTGSQRDMQVTRTRKTGCFDVRMDYTISVHAVDGTSAHREADSGGADDCFGVCFGGPCD